MKSVATLLQHAWDSHGRAANGFRTPLLPDISGPRAAAALASLPPVFDVQIELRFKEFIAASHPWPPHPVPLPSPPRPWFTEICC